MNRVLLASLLCGLLVVVMRTDGADHKDRVLIITSCHEADQLRSPLSSHEVTVLTPDGDGLEKLSSSAEELKQSCEVIILSDMIDGSGGSRGAYELSWAQHQAIRDFVLAGGKLIVTTGRFGQSLGTGGFLRAPISEILPVQIVRTDDLLKVDQANADTERCVPEHALLKPLTDCSLAPGTRLHMVRARPAAQVLLAAKRPVPIPLIAVARQGKGTVVYVSQGGYGGGLLRDVEQFKTFLSGCLDWLRENPSIDPNGARLMVEDKELSLIPTEPLYVPANLDQNLFAAWLNVNLRAWMATPGNCRADPYGNMLIVAAWGASDSLSEFKGKPESIALAARLMDETIQQLSVQPMTAEKNLRSRHTFSYGFLNILQSFDMLRNIETIPVPTKDRWRAAITEVIDFEAQVETKADWWGKSCVPWEMNKLYDFAFGSTVLGKSELKDLVERQFQIIQARALPGGAFSYGRGENDSAAYHHATIMALALYYRLTQDRGALELIRSGKDYYPHQADRNGMIEGWSDIEHKHVWTRIGSAAAPMIVASVLNDPSNKRVAEILSPHFGDGEIGQVLGAQFWKPIVRTELPANYCVFDPNIMGPRGLFGDFSWGATAGHLRDTFSGVVLSDPNKLAPWDAALQSACIEVTGSKGAFVYADRSDTSRSAQSMVGKQWASFSVSFPPRKGYSYNPDAPSPEALPVKVTQFWFYTPGVVAAFLSVDGTKTDATTGQTGILRFAPRKCWAHAEKEDLFAFGKLRCSMTLPQGVRCQLVPARLSTQEGAHSKTVADAWEVTVARQKGESSRDAGLQFAFAVYPEGAAKAPENFRAQTDPHGPILRFQQGNRSYLMALNTDEKNPWTIELPREFKKDYGRVYVSGGNTGLPPKSVAQEAIQTGQLELAPFHHAVLVW